MAAMRSMQSPWRISLMGKPSDGPRVRPAVFGVWARLTFGLSMIESPFEANHHASSAGLRCTARAFRKVNVRIGARKRLEPQAFMPQRRRAIDPTPDDHLAHGPPQVSSHHAVCGPCFIVTAPRARARSGVYAAAQAPLGPKLPCADASNIPHDGRSHRPASERLLRASADRGSPWR